MDQFHQLRRLNYPDVVQAALQQLVHNLNQERAIPGLGGVDNVSETLVRDYIFFQGYSRKKLNNVEELQLLQILLTFIHQQPHSRDRHQIFKTLFSNKQNNSYVRDILIKLVSLGICTKDKYVLQCCAIWMKAQGVASAPCLKLAESLVNDFCVVTLDKDDAIVQLPKIDRLFTCNLITASFAFYKPDKPKNIRLIPEVFLAMIANWLEMDPSLCLECVKAKEKARRHTTSMFDEGEESRTVASPIPGILMQCIAAAMFKSVNKSSQSTTMDQKVIHLYSKLLVATMQSLLIFQQVYHDRYLELVTLSDLKEMKQLMTTAVKMASYEKVSNACDIYAQSLQVSLATGAVRTTPEELKELTSGFSQNRLLEIIQKKQLHEDEPMDQ